MRIKLHELPKQYLYGFLIGLFLISLFLRVYNLALYPQGFHFDEATAGYNAYSILETGSTIKNGSWPLYLNTFGDYRPMGIVYLMIPSIAFFGLTEFAVRFPTALIGALSPLVLFFLVRRFFVKTDLAVISAVLLALSPWHIMLSRATSEAIIAVFLVMIIMLCAHLVKATGSIFWGIILYFSMLISFISYHPINLFLLLMIPTFFIIFRQDFLKHKRSGILFISVFVIYLVFPFLSGVVFSNATGRLSQVVNIFGDEAKKHLTVQLVEEGIGSNVYVTRLFHNKVINATLDIGDRYIDYVTPKFLLFKGGLPNRYVIPDAGVLTIVELVGLFIVLLSLVSMVKKKEHLLFLTWVLIGILPAAITSDDHPNVSRVVLMMPAVQILAAYGITRINFQKRPIYLMFIGVIGIMIGLWHYGYYFHQYVIHARFTQWLDRSYPAKEAVQKMALLPRDKKVLVTTRFLGTDAFVLFYEKVDPKLAQTSYSQQGNRLKTLYNYTFVDNECPSQEYPVGYDYFVEHYWCIEPKEFPVTPIYGADGTKMFKIVETKELQK